MKILQVLRAPTGGLWRHAADLSAEMARRGHQIGLVMDSNFSDRQTEQRLAALSDSLALGIHKIPISRMPGPGDMAAAIRLRTLARKMNIDVLHGHGAKGGLYARLARISGARAAAFYTPHGGVLNFEQTSFSGKLYRKVEKWLSHVTDTLIFESDFARRAFIDQIGVPSCPHLVIHNGLSPDEFAPIASDPDATDFVFIGELRPVKGVSFMIDALVGLKAKDGHPATLTLVGGGPLLGEIEEQITRLGLKERVHMAGVQPARKMFQRGRCVVVPSLAESLPYIILEAAAAEKPMICTNVGGVNEIYGPTEKALLPAGNTPALQTAMQAFLNEPEAAKAEMQKRLAHIRAGFSIERMTDNIEVAYQKAITSR